MNLKLFYIVFLSFALISCSQKLPMRSETKGAALIVPTRVANTSSHGIGYSVEVFLEKIDPKTNQVENETSIKVLFTSSKKYRIYTDLKPGYYRAKAVKQIKALKLQHRFIPKIDIDYSFRLEQGCVTLSPMFINVSQYDAYGGRFYFNFTHHRTYDFEKKRYKNLVLKEENISDWNMDCGDSFVPTATDN